MQIETTALKAGLLRFSTNIDATGAEYDRLSELAERIGEQVRGVVESHGGAVLPDGGFAVGDGGDAAVTLDLSAVDVHNLVACCERITWPFSRFMPSMKTAVRALRKTDLPAWAAQAEIEATLEKMTPEQRKALAAKASE